MWSLDHTLWSKSLMGLLRVSVDQLTFGLVASKKGYPRMKLSSPMLAIRNLCDWLWLSLQMVRITTLVMDHSLFTIPSTLRSCWAMGSFWVGKLYFLTILGWTRFSVAPLFRRAFSLALHFSVYKWTHAFINRFFAIYTDLSEQAQMIAIMFRLWENPFLFLP